MTTTDGKDMNVLSKTPEEIKKAIQCCIIGSCKFCPFNEHYALNEDALCDGKIGEIAMLYIEQLKTDACNWEIEATLLKSKCEQLERERDAAVEDIPKATCNLCNVCMHYDVQKRICEFIPGEEDVNMLGCSRFEWRGVEEE